MCRKISTFGISATTSANTVNENYSFVDTAKAVNTAARSGFCSKVDDVRETNLFGTLNEFGEYTKRVWWVCKRSWVRTQNKWIMYPRVNERRLVFPVKLS
ncbi:hypothetical protein POVCU2_0030800 [Plasmodium ovale curtisi]|uniref:Uncharacterized protein n=1 Tax=Plasmodium ovale curtisi TaxID=864141 RepID=A0A1A8W042_PLAOA|nr:hypothetical protein POVCU2_0030800 [Plasmodium ovale curtisi]SBS94380.1 hypothetical protein POVCU1_028160 [Plasmodium ovale curtisi]